MAQSWNGEATRRKSMESSFSQKMVQNLLQNKIIRTHVPILYA
jgi:hypothetical protein